MRCVKRFTFVCKIYFVIFLNCISNSKVYCMIRTTVLSLSLSLPLIICLGLESCAIIRVLHISCCDVLYSEVYLKVLSLNNVVLP